MAQQDIYKLVEEVNKRKQQSSSDIEAVFNMLDESNNIPLENVRESVKNTYSSEDSDKYLASLKDKKVTESRVVRRPTFPTTVENFENRSDCFLAIISAVDYGTNNVQEYVDGHMKALEKYYSEALANSKDLQLLEARVYEEIQVSSRNKADYYDKGYYDGLNYVLRALKRSATLMSERIYRALKRELG